MEHEYKRDERQAYDSLTLNTSGSSARLVREDEIDPAELRQKQMECGSEGQYIEMFCNRYRDRGIAGRIHTDAAKQEKKEAQKASGSSEVRKPASSAPRTKGYTPFEGLGDLFAQQ